MKEVVELAMDADTVSGDILHYVQQETHRNSKLRGIEQAILKKTQHSANGMFLWATMMLTYIKSAPTARI